ncbi:MetQ/NlpA family ABC transporter substrate-binding protein [Shouchella sp. JSM 1781072]|uniref:MetQ/NlpA family ABC transporter substrate-binding protein n=1 Tax=Bacillaceae TaxID=186817 RepID=UPI000C077882|nr:MULTISPECIES: MetQ/NlpA family ABC transporter substrate-binding protein [Bacillaceae]UTR05534.1 MetQ/NlpA family ABC transporter substrate-binding protein [Alkalihalobacillus sp. LMS6]
MNKFLKAVGIAGVSVALVACGSSEDENNELAENEDGGTTIRISASNIPHAEILEEAAPILEEQEIELDIRIAQDYILPNRALADGEVDANYFQHRPYLESQLAENENYDFAEAGAIHVEPIGLYSQDYEDLNDLPDGATVMMSNSVADQGRILSLLQENGVITLEDGVSVEATEADIVDNPKNLSFNMSPDAELLPQAYQNNEAEVVAINSNYALGADISPTEEAIAIEGEDNPYVNLIVVQSGNENDEAIQALVDVLKSDEIQSFIEETYDGAVIPAE